MFLGLAHFPNMSKEKRKIIICLDDDDEPSVKFARPGEVITMDERLPVAIAVRASSDHPDPFYVLFLPGELDAINWLDLHELYRWNLANKNCVHSQADKSDRECYSRLLSLVSNNQPTLCIPKVEINLLSLSVDKF